MTPGAVAGFAGTVFLAATTVSLWTARVALAASGRRCATAVFAAIEPVTFMLVFHLIASNLDAIDRLLGYALGMAVGTLVGLYTNDRLSAGQSFVHVTVCGHRLNLGPALHDLGWPAPAELQPVTG